MSSLKAWNQLTYSIPRLSMWAPGLPHSPVLKCLGGAEGWQEARDCDTPWLRLKLMFSPRAGSKFHALPALLGSSGVRWAEQDWQKSQQHLPVRLIPANMGTSCPQSSCRDKTREFSGMSSCLCNTRALPAPFDKLWQTLIKARKGRADFFSISKRRLFCQHFARAWECEIGCSCAACTSTVVLKWRQLILVVDLNCCWKVLHFLTLSPINRLRVTWESSCARLSSL